MADSIRETAERYADDPSGLSAGGSMAADRTEARNAASLRAESPEGLSQGTMRSGDPTLAPSALGPAKVSLRDQDWQLSWRADPVTRGLADRHYNRQAVGAAQFVPPGACVVLRTPEGGAGWITSWPLAEYVQHAWAGAWINSLFRNERQDLYLSSDLIEAAVAATLDIWPTPPPLGMVTFVDPSKTRRKRDPGRCYRRAGFRHVGFTQGGLWVFQMLPDEMPAPAAAAGKQEAMAV